MAILRRSSRPSRSTPQTAIPVRAKIAFSILPSDGFRESLSARAWGYSTGLLLLVLNLLSFRNRFCLLLTGRKFVFNYEKRIRLRSPPEKVFTYFASLRTPEGELLMKPADLMRAIVPVFPPSESHLVREGYLRGQRSPGELWETDKEEFKKVMALMRAHNRQGAFHRDGLRTGLKISCPGENGGLVEYFFGEDGRACLKHDKFVQFLRDLHEEGLAIVCSKRGGDVYVHSHSNWLQTVPAKPEGILFKLLNRVDQLKNVPDLRDMCITFEEFKNFAEIRSKLQPFSLALFSYGEANGLLTWKDFKRAAYHVCGVLLVFPVFDSNRDGSLSAEEFVGVLHKWEMDIA